MTTPSRIAQSIRQIALTCVVAALSAAPLEADDTARSLSRIKEIQADVAAAERAFRDAWNKQADKDADDPAVDKLFDAFRAKRLEGIDEVITIAKSNPASEAAFEGLHWLLKEPKSTLSVDFPVALALLREHHARDPRIGPGIAILSYYPPLQRDPGYQEAYQLLEAVVATNSDKTARGQAALGLAWRAKNRFEMAEYENAPDMEQLAADATREFEHMARDYGDCQNLRSLGASPPTGTLAVVAESELFQLRNLRVGRPAPDIVGEDLRGQEFHLSDYRGKVTLLVFWASWCGPCMGDVPHERDLVARFHDRPFVLVGVNGDDTRDAAATAVTKHEIPWRSFWNGEKGAGGPIATSWNVRGWPTVYVIDHQGIIRHKHLRGDDLDAPLEELIATAESTAASRQK